MRCSPEELLAETTEVPKPNSAPPKRADDFYRAHDDRIAVIIGSGPSLRGFNFGDLNDSRFVTFAINNEAWNNRELYAPDFWIFGDDHVGTARVAQHLPKRTTVLTKETNIKKLTDGRRAIWSDRIFGFDTRSKANWSFNSEWVPLSKTTGTAAVALAARMGFKKIVLLGVDCFGSKSLGYYHDGRTKTRMPVTREDGDLYITAQHDQMLNSWRIVADGLDRWGWAGKIYQTSLSSPITHWQKKTWTDAVNA